MNWYFKYRIAEPMDDESDYNVPSFSNIRGFNVHYPVAGSMVSGLRVMQNVPNTASIRSSFTNYKILPGIREVPISDFDVGKSFFYAKNDFDKARALMKEIGESGEIAPLIVAVDSEGPYILEGAHRLYALKLLGVETFPALVVLDMNVEATVSRSGASSGKVRAAMHDYDGESSTPA